MTSTTTVTADPQTTTGRIGSELAVEARGLVKAFGDQRAVDAIDLSVLRGEVFGVLGPNGAGKTTMLKMLATLLPIDAGEASVFGVDVAARAARRAPAPRRDGPVRLRRRAAHRHREPRSCSRRLQGLGRGDARRTADRLLEQFDLTEAASKPIKQFSGGMRRRLDLAASLITRPPLIFLDEPTTGLDPRTRGQMWVTIRELVSEGSTVLLTTQYLDEADQLADRIQVIDRGRTVALGHAGRAEVLDRRVLAAAAAGRGRPTSSGPPASCSGCSTSRPCRAPSPDASRWP